MTQDLEKVKEIISQSGNTFHCIVLKFLQDRDWTVLISPYYNDNVTSKPREIDLIAEKAFDARNRHSKFLGTINVKLFIECKYISQKTVFWFHNKDKQKAENLVIQSTPQKRGNIYNQRHHYLEGDTRVAKLFADERKKTAENEIFYKALNQSLNAMVYYRNKESIIDSEPNQKEYILHTVNYPIIACNSFENLFRVEIDTDVEPSDITDNFQLEVNYAYMTSDGKNRNEYFLIDILNFELFDSFLKKIEEDAKLINSFLNL